MRAMLRPTAQTLVPRNPCVLLSRVSSEEKQKVVHSISTETAISSLFGKADFSDVTLMVGNQRFFAHRLVLQASSEVFARMLSADWNMDSDGSIIRLEEDSECTTVFESFLRYLYTGKCSLDNESVISMYILADKYAVLLLTDECVRIINQGLKLIVSYKKMPMHSNVEAVSSSSNVAATSSSSAEVHSFPEKYLILSRSDRVSCLLPQLVGHDAFPLAAVIRIIRYSNNMAMTEAAEFNLLSRLADNVQEGSYVTWYTLDESLLLKVISNDYFYCSEYKIYVAAKEWLQHRGSNGSSEDRDAQVIRIMQHVRFAVISPSDLYSVSKDDFVMRFDVLRDLVQSAISYQLFAGCCDDADKAKWSGPLFTPRRMRSVNV